MTKIYLQTEVDDRLESLKLTIQGATAAASRDMASVADALMNAVALHNEQLSSITARRTALETEEIQATEDFHSAVNEAFNAIMTIRKGMSSKPVEPETKGEPLKEPPPDNVLQIAAE